MFAFFPNKYRAGVYHYLLEEVLKTISNYTNHLADTPLDEAFEPEKLEFAAV